MAQNAPEVTKRAFFAKLSCEDYFYAELFYMKMSPEIKKKLNSTDKIYQT